ncbi:MULTISPECIES: MOP flippase family protein [Serratia]|uniref:Lipopolysaccharide biosynthesis protein wzxC n=1 Tax=Serratia ficaria TaxID=61651 RepID=A0A240BQ54_SERFI|nr:MULTISPECIES: MOP flippase family protein [Serratia]REF45569.1 lipopolysaccharide exporter [Serratia ficaria]CAI0840202.1 Lipopolysaccharide biosynthesis protein wzxC [Serratia ficaria]CAI0872631.1 Lipopolysaccharide biosynthesis protein wzxC [Serratia ficaria]CAI0884119.1 Lipopolysaccharide biosynthesis protein wzxC [Serratia ficaria]CAI0909338.1 Lipopolysaccharide biosynthesis protein wzxC [Serratia ficaria]
MSLREKTVRGAKWSAISTVIIIGLSFLQLTLLSRMIERSEFGLLTIAMVVIALADTISDFGISNSIVQKKDITESQLTTLYWLNVGIGFTVSVVTFLTSGLIADALNAPGLEPLVKIISIAFLLIPHGQQFRALMQKELDFATIGKIESFSYFLGFAFSLGFATIYPFAIVAIYGYLINALVRTLLFAYFGRSIYRPSMKFSFFEVKSNIKFGAYLTADSLVNFLNTNVSTAILARTLGTVVTGGYNLAYNVAVMPPTKLNPIITRVLFPAFAKIQDDSAKLKDSFYKLISLVGIINFPALLGLMVVSHSFVLFVFGERWLFITPILQILCVVGLLRSIGNPIGSLLMAKARVDISFKFNVFKTLLFIPSMLLGVKLGGAIGVALAFLIVQVINTYLSYFILIKPVLGPSYRQYIDSLWLPFKLTVPTIVVSWCVGYFMPPQVSNAVSLFMQIFLGLFAFAITIYFTKAPLINEVKLQLIKSEKLRKIFRVEC